jgi:hypothetical protein
LDSFDEYVGFHLRKKDPQIIAYTQKYVIIVEMMNFYIIIVEMMGDKYISTKGK